MKSFNYRRTGVLSLNLLILTLLAGCIVVVEEDDDRHRRFRGSEWSLEIIFYRAQTLSVPERDVEIQFLDDGILAGSTSCGPLSGTYEVDNEQRLEILDIQSGSDCAAGSSADVFLNELSRTVRYDVDESSLRLTTQEAGFMTFRQAP